MKQLAALNKKVFKSRRKRFFSWDQSPGPSRDNKKADKHLGLCFINRKYGKKARGKKSQTTRKTKTPSSYRDGRGKRGHHVYDRATGRQFLLDTGTEISILPVQLCDKNQPSKLKLLAANNTVINTFGCLTLDLGLRRPLTWNFQVAVVLHAFIVADFLRFH